jgi:hypothetical protein
MCHCLDCQRRSGSPFSVAVFYPREHVRIAQGSSKVYQRPSASGFDVSFHFCSRCGSNIFWKPRRLPDLIGVAIGAFADPDFPMPEQSVWTTSKHHWLDLPETMTAWEQNPVRPAGR